MKMIKILTVVTLLSLVTACGTMGGAVSGAGRDLHRLGGWIDYSK